MLAGPHRGRYERRTVPGRDSHFFVLVLIALLTVVAYAGSFEGTWISDDTEMIPKNPTVQALTVANVTALATSRTDSVNYIPLNFLSLAVDYGLWGPHPAGFHLTNLLIHVANVCLVYFLVLGLGETRGLAAAVSILWALHPVQVETVAWISERKNVLSTLFFLLAFHASLRADARPTWGRYALVVACYVAALVSKVNTIVLPVVLIAYAIVMRRRVRTRDLVLATVLLACGAAVAFANLHGNQSHGDAYHGGSLAVTLRTSATTIPRYLRNVVAPFDLSSYYPVPLRGSWLDPSVAFAAAIVVALVAATLWLGFTGRPEGFWLAWFGITLAPMLNLVPFPALMNDRYLYVPLVGALVVLVRMARTALARVGALRAGPALVGGAALACAALTMLRVPVFRNELNLWADMGLRTSYITADQPYGPGPRTEEKRLLTEAVARHPDRAALYNNLGGFAFEENRMMDARTFLTRAYELDPTDPVIALNLGRTYLRLGQVDDAIRTLEVATALEPPSFFPHLNLARAYLRKNDLVRARAELTRAKAIKSDPYFWQSFEQTLERAERAS